MLRGLYTVAMIGAQPFLRRKLRRLGFSSPPWFTA